MKRIAIITLLGTLLLPAVSGALTVRTDHRAVSQSGGVTVSEGSAVVTGDQNSSVQVQSVINGTQGHTQITTVQDGVQQQETHDFIVAPSGGTVQVVTPSSPPANVGRTPRAGRTPVAIVKKMVIEKNAPISIHSALIVGPIASASPKTWFAMVPRVFSDFFTQAIFLFGMGA